MTQPQLDHSAAAEPQGEARIAAAMPIGPAPSPGVPPPHRLWETLETAYAAPEERPPVPEDERLAPYIALPVALAVSLALWVVIIELVLKR